MVQFYFKYMLCDHNIIYEQYEEQRPHNGTPNSTNFTTDLQPLQVTYCERIMRYLFSKQ